jgi:ribosomal protein L18
MIKQFHANKARLRRHQRIRRHLEGTTGRPRLSVFRSGEHIYAQIIDDTTGLTLVAASSLDESLRNFKPEAPSTTLQEKVGDAIHAVADAATDVAEMAAEVLPGTGKGKSAKAEKAPKAPAKGQAQQKGAAGKGGKPGTQAKTVLPQAQKGQKKTPVEALALIANNRRVAVAREVGKLVAQRAKEKGVSQVVFDRAGYAYHGRVAALAEGAREVGLEF